MFKNILLYIYYDTLKMDIAVTGREAERGKIL